MRHVPLQLFEAMFLFLQLPHRRLTLLFEMLNVQFGNIGADQMGRLLRWFSRIDL